MKAEDCFAGGQGRTAEDVADSAVAMLVVGIVGVGLLFGWLILSLLGV